MLINYAKQTIEQDDIDSVLEVLSSDWLTQGPKIKEFEKSLKKKFNSKYCTVVSSGTAALHLAGRALGWKKGDIIITSPLTFAATGNSVLYSSAAVDFVDIDQSNNIDVEKVEKKIEFYKKKSKKIKAIIGVDYAGHPCNWKRLRELADYYKIKLINDNCHAMGAKYKNEYDYAIKYADIVTHSYHPAKNITTGEGGAILTNEEEFHEKIQRLRSHGIYKKKKYDSKDKGSWFYEINELGFNYRITDFQSALGINQLKKLDKFIKRRREIANIYNDKFGKNKNFIIPYNSKEVYHAYHLYPLQAKFDKKNKNKKLFFEKMKKFNLNFMVHYVPLHLQPLYKKKFNFKKGDFPLSEQFYKQVFSIPIFPKLTNDNINFISSKILQYFENKK
tara:strand:- start:753 stop:1922 length:1170 start_codon:yes stop_codon:yes gene_type:complete